MVMMLILHSNSLINALRLCKKKYTNHLSSTEKKLSLIISFTFYTKNKQIKHRRSQHVYSIPIRRNNKLVTK